MEKKTLTVKNILELHSGIDILRQEKIDRQLSYALMRTRAKTLPVFEAVQEMSKPSPALLKYSEARNLLIREHALPGAQATAQNIPLKDPQAFDAALKVLDSANEEALAEIKEIEAARESKLKETVEIEVHMAEFDILPKEIHGTVMEVIWPMIKEPKDA